jgi:hypothetical protein
VIEVIFLDCHTWPKQIIKGKRFVVWRHGKNMDVDAARFSDSRNRIDPIHPFVPPNIVGIVYQNQIGDSITANHSGRMQVYALRSGREFEELENLVIRVQNRAGILRL